MSIQRLQYFDVIKGIAIILVVMGHVLTMCIRDIDQSFAFKIIGEIHMPLFFFISGFFSYKSTNSDLFIQPKITQRFKQLIIPFFIVSALWLWYFPHSKLDSPLNTTFEGMYHDVWKNGYWFTLCLFEIILIYALNCIIFKLLNSTFLHITTFVFTWILIGLLALNILPTNISNLLSLPLVFQFYPIFAIGVLARKHQNKFMTLINKQSILTANIIFAAPLIYCICYYWEFSWIPQGSTYILKSIFHVILASITINIIKVWTDSSNNKVIEILSKVGKESLSIYLLHYFLLFPLKFLQEPLREMGLSFIPTVFTALIFASIIIAMVLVINYIISKSKTLALLLTGKI